MLKFALGMVFAGFLIAVYEEIESENAHHAEELSKLGAQLAALKVRSN